MSWSETTILVIGIVAVLVLVGWWWASRLDRLHRRAERTRSTLDVQLARRAAVSLELAASHLLDPAASVLVAEAAHRAVDAERQGESFGAGRTLAESDLSRTLRGALGEAEDIEALRETTVGVDILADLAGAWYRAEIARRFHNDAVTDVQRLRAVAPVRWFHLAGRTPLPASVEIDDRLPDALAVEAATPRGTDASRT